ncbi:MAG: response regulator transcription factor [Pirellulaceae bacterium]
MNDVPPTVIVVDDEPETRASFAALMTSLNLAVETYQGGAELLQHPEINRPGCAIVDFHLEGIDGLELYHQLRERGCELPVILISAYLDVRKTARAMEQGVFRVLEKPYHDDELGNAVRRAIEYDRGSRAKRFYRRDFAHRLDSLDTRERLTLDLIIAGHPNKAVERRLDLSTRTVDRIRASILDKMQFLSFVELAAAYGAARAVAMRDESASRW